MRPSRDSRWEVSLPADGTDPYLSATLWLLEHETGALVGTLPVAPSVHARTLFEAVPVVDPARPRRLAQAAGLALVLVEPAAETLEALDARAFAVRPAVMLLPSPPGSERRAWQDAWCWAQARPTAHLPVQADWLEPATLDPTGILTAPEVWALALRAGAAPQAAAALRRSGSVETSVRPGPRLLARWRA